MPLASRVGDTEVRRWNAPPSPLGPGWIEGASSSSCSLGASCLCRPGWYPCSAPLRSDAAGRGSAPMVPTAFSCGSFGVLETFSRSHCDVWRRGDDEREPFWTRHCFHQRLQGGRCAGNCFGPRAAGREVRPGIALARGCQARVAPRSRLWGVSSSGLTGQTSSTARSGFSPESRENAQRQRQGVRQKPRGAAT